MVRREKTTITALRKLFATMSEPAIVAHIQTCNEVELELIWQWFGMKTCDPATCAFAQARGDSDEVGSLLGKKTCPCMGCLADQELLPLRAHIALMDRLGFPLIDDDEPVARPAIKGAELYREHVSQPNGAKVKGRYRVDGSRGPTPVGNGEYVEEELRGAGGYVARVKLRRWKP